MIRLIGLITLMFGAFFLTAQTNPCGTSDWDIITERLLANKASFNENGAARNNETVYIPITFHIINKADGTGGVAEDKVIDMLCALNEAYAEMEFVFYLKGGTFNYYNETNVYNDPASTSSSVKMTIQKNDAGKNSMNIFITKSAQTGGNGTTLGYYDPQRDWIVLRISEVNGTSGTLPHEAGHFFSLMHPHNGWDATPWNATTHGNPVTSNSSPGGVPNELADGSNCEISGDFLCDTPADYQLGFGWPNCNYTGGCKDPQGGLLDPDEFNFMGYFIGCTPYHFSNDQMEMVHQDYATPQRNYLKVNYTPKTDLITDAVNIVAPANGSTVATFNGVELEWEPVTHADKYVVILSQSLFTFKYISTTNKLFLTDLEADKNYSFKVFPFHEGGGCGSFSSSSSFSTGNTQTSSNDLSHDVNQMSIHPNPSSSNQVINLNIDSKSEFKGQVIVTNISGKEVLNFNRSFTQGTNNISLELNDVSEGLYLVRLKTNAGSISRKLIITN